MLTMLHDALAVRLQKEAAQIEFYRQLRVLNPNNLPDMPLALSEYPSLNLSAFQNDWAEYTRSAKRDVQGPVDLVAWWQAHPSSAFRDHVIFLITSPVSAGCIERFFSLCGQVHDDQWALANASRRLQFMHKPFFPPLVCRHSAWYLAFFVVSEKMV